MFQLIFWEAFSIDLLVTLICKSILILQAESALSRYFDASLHTSYLFLEVRLLVAIFYGR